MERYKIYVDNGAYSKVVEKVWALLLTSPAINLLCTEYDDDGNVYFYVESDSDTRELLSEFCGCDFGELLEL